MNHNPNNYSRSIILTVSEIVEIMVKNNEQESDIGKYTGNFEEWCQIVNALKEARK